MGTDIKRPDDDRLGTALASAQIRDQVLGGLAPWMNERQFTAAALSTMSDSTYAEFTTAAKIRAILQFALLGLYPGPQNHAYIIPRKGDLTVMPGFRGYIYLARQLPGVHDVTVHLVHTSDTFDVAAVGNGDFEVVRHDYDPLPPKGGRVFDAAFKALKGVYVRMEMKDGTYRYHFTTIDKVMEAKSCAKASNVWEKFAAEMAMKTGVRNAQARGFFHGDRVVEARIAHLVAADDLALGNDPARVREPRKLASPAPENAVEKLRAMLGAGSETRVEPHKGPETGEAPSDEEKASCAPHSAKDQDQDQDQDDPPFTEGDAGQFDMPL